MFPAVFKVVFSSFLSVSQKKKKKGHRFFCPSKVHLTRYNLRRCQFRLFERFFKVLKNFLRFCYPFLRFFGNFTIFKVFFKGLRSAPNPALTLTITPKLFITLTTTLTRALNNRIRVELACHVNKTVFLPITLKGSSFTLSHGG